MRIAPFLLLGLVALAPAQGWRERAQSAFDSASRWTVSTYRRVERETGLEEKVRLAREVWRIRGAISWETLSDPTLLSMLTGVPAETLRPYTRWLRYDSWFEALRGE